MEHYIGPKRPNFLYHVLIFILVTFAWIFFRLEDSVTAGWVIVRICTDFIAPINWGSSTFSTLLTILLLLVFILREYLLYKQKLPQRYAIEYILLMLGIGLFGASSEQFVYFQF